MYNIFQNQQILQPSYQEMFQYVLKCSHFKQSYGKPSSTIFLHSVQKYKWRAQNLGRSELHRGIVFSSANVSAMFSKACQHSLMSIEGGKKVKNTC